MDILRLTLRQLQIFVAVAQCGTTMAASAQVALSQSATSSAVNELERLLSLRLFDRAGKRLLLNDNGRALLPRALALLDGATGIEKMSRSGLAQSQSLRIGASSTIGNYVLPQLLAGYLSAMRLETAPAWQSSVMIGNTETVCEAVANFEIDVGLIEGPCHQATLQVRPWLQDELVVVAGLSHPWVNAMQPSGGTAPISLAALREAIWLLREPGSGTREATDQWLLPHLRSHRRSIEIGSSEAIKHAAAQGLGVACLSYWVVKDLIDAAQLIRVDTTLPKMVRQCHIVVHHDKHPTPALTHFLDQAMALVTAP